MTTDELKDLIPSFIWENRTAINAVMSERTRHNSHWFLPPILPPDNLFPGLAELLQPLVDPDNTIGVEVLMNRNEWKRVWKRKSSNGGFIRRITQKPDVAFIWDGDCLSISIDFTTNADDSRVTSMVMLVHSTENKSLQRSVTNFHEPVIICERRRT